MKLQEILNQPGIDRHEFLARVWYPGNIEAAEEIFRTEIIDPNFHEPLPHIFGVALQEAIVAREKGDDLRYKNMLGKALDCIKIDFDDSVEAPGGKNSRYFSLEEELGRINFDPEISNFLIEQLLDLKIPVAEYHAFEIAVATNNQEKIDKILSNLEKEGHYAFAALNYYEKQGNKEKVHELMEKELETMINNGYGLEYALKHFPERAKEVALRAVSIRAFTELQEGHRWEIYSFLGDDVPEERCDDMNHIRNRLLKRLEQDIMDFEGEERPDVLFGRITFLKGERPEGARPDYRGLITLSQLIRVYRKALTSPDFKDRHIEKAELSFEGYGKTGDLGFLKTAMEAYIRTQHYEKVLECARLLGDEKQIELYGSIIKMMDDAKKPKVN